MKEKTKENEEIIGEFIDEKSYQQYKKEMCINSNYLKIEEWNYMLKHKANWTLCFNIFYINS